MKLTLAFAAAALSAIPAFAQETTTCAEYLAMDNTQRMEAAAALEAFVSQSSDQRPDAAMIQEKLAADCEGKVEILIVDLVKAY